MMRADYSVQPAAMAPEAAKLPVGIVHYLTLWSVIGLVLWYAWTGFTASDDGYYAMAGTGWASQFPYVANHLATIRAVIGIPIGVLVAILGESELSVTLSTCLFFVATASLTLAMLSRIVGAGAATVACCAMSTVPLFALKSTIPCAEAPELFFIALAFWLFWVAIQRERRVWLLVGAGCSSALAFSAHEVAAGLPVFFGVLFLAGFRIPRRQYWWMALGFLAVIALECLYYGVTTGNPLHRLGMLSEGASVAAGTSGDRVHVGFLQIAAGGTIHVAGAIDPFLMFLTHHDFGLLGFVALPALWSTCVTRWKDASLPLMTARLSAAFAIVWLLWSAIMLRHLILLPRYYTVTAYCLFVVVAIWACVDLWPRRRRWVVVGLSVFAAANLVSIHFDEKNPRFGERALVEYLGQSSGPIYTDPLTAHNVDWYCRWSGEDCGRIHAGRPKPGMRYFHNPKNTQGPNRFVRPDELPQYRPEAGWSEVWQKTEGPKPIAALAGWIGSYGALPGPLMSKLAKPRRSVMAYEVPR